MSNVISGNMVGGGAPLKTLILTDENGNEVVGVVTDNAQLLTANAETDIREGVTAVTDNGIETGSAVIPNYETTTGQRIIASGSSFKLIGLTDNDKYDYTELQCIICPFNSSMDESVSAEQVIIGDNVYNSNSVDIVTTVVKNSTEKSIDFNMTNTADIPYVIRYFTYKKLY